MICQEIFDLRNTEHERAVFLKHLKQIKAAGVIIHTCNRVEFYGGSGEVPEDVARHLFQLVSGLESIFIGETFIQGQVKEAYQQAAVKLKLDAGIHRLFQWAFLTGKRVRTETALSRGAMSHSHAVVEIIRSQISDYQEKRFAFVGINKINKTIMNFLKGNIHQSFVLCNRTFEKALELENQFNSKAYKLDHLKLALAQSDIVISATSAPHSIIRNEHIPFSHPLTIFDLAVPNDVSSEVQNLSNVKYYDIKEIEKQVNDNIAVRVDEIAKASVIINDEISRFMEYQKKYFSRKRSVFQ